MYIYKYISWLSHHPLPSLVGFHTNQSHQKSDKVSDFRGATISQFNNGVLQVNTANRSFGVFEKNWCFYMSFLFDSHGEFIMIIYDIDFWRRMISSTYYDCKTYIYIYIHLICNYLPTSGYSVVYWLCLYSFIHLMYLWLWPFIKHARRKSTSRDCTFSALTLGPHTSEQLTT